MLNVHLRISERRSSSSLKIEQALTTPHNKETSVLRNLTEESCEYDNESEVSNKRPVHAMEINLPSPGIFNQLSSSQAYFFATLEFGKTPTTPQRSVL
jgi:hypothetical protein